MYQLQLEQSTYFCKLFIKSDSASSVLAKIDYEHYADLRHVEYYVKWPGKDIHWVGMRDL